MIDYSPLEIWHKPELIKYAISIARKSAKESRTQESYFPTNTDEFYPHTWVVDAICEALKGN